MNETYREQNDNGSQIIGKCQCGRYVTSDTKLRPLRQRIMEHVAHCDRNGRIVFADGYIQFVTGYIGELPSIARLTAAVNWVKRR